MLSMSRIKTGILGLDEMLQGGFMVGDAVMIAGSAGTGKTTLALQSLVNGITQFGENGLYLTFEQLPDQIYRDAINFGWDLRKLEQEGKLRVMCTSPNLLSEADGGEDILDEVMKEIRPRRIVIDSLSHLAMYVDEKELRKETYRLIMYLKVKGLSSFLIWEATEVFGQVTAITDVGMSFLVDCIVLLKPVEIQSSMRKALVVLKMRGSDHDKRLREYEITSTGIKVASSFVDYEGLLTGSPRRTGAEKFVTSFRELARKRR